MNSFIRAFFPAMIGVFLFMTAVSASPVDSVDASYDFRQIKHVMIYDIELTDTDISDSEAMSLREHYRIQSQKLLQIPSLDKKKLHRKISLAAGKDLDILERSDAEEYGALIRDHIKNFADIYVRAELLSYETDTCTIPAHTEWTTVTDYDTWYDKDGHPHTVSHTRTLPYYVPDQTVPYTHVQLRFIGYESGTDKIVFMREELREDLCTSNRLSTYNKIVRSYFRDLRKKIK